MTKFAPRRALSLFEMLAALTVIGTLAALIITRFGGVSSDAKSRACESNRRNIEVQCRLWYRTKGTWPASNLSDISADSNYLPAGIPVCPVDGSAYSFSSATGKITGHAH